MTPKPTCAGLGLLLALAAPAVLAGFDEAAAAFAAADYATAQSELRPLLDKHDPRAQYAMGVLYENGFGVSKDLPQAAAWYLKAAEQGNSDAQYNLGAMHEHGVGMPVNYPEAARWYRPAAEQGDIDALSNLGVLYQNGQGVAQDKVLALALYNVSVAYAGNGQTQAAQNRQGLANQMPLDEVKQALALTEALLKPGNLQPGLEQYLEQTAR
ncbi:tetratricopeptide repeat protein [Pseudomonas sp. N040]|uniref:tetratricopeptide repeat protein n=1 Tax=Pseudomonas sp. N040 TaxID=2785325 RepID=UPI0018A25311|nr:tetratricopeptide repeat protein [Pseudomonas sp. N040]MBF7728681.1 sel1 repeat family protein [Pseudomonas sp. N040]MBW7012321.1 sel1 repeat family protein [Pseudomonas sp. N040]